jgi:hypothetical protein
MARRRRILPNLKSIAGVILIGLGLVVLYGNLADTIARSSGLVDLGTDATQTFGVITVVGLGVSRLFQCYLLDRSGFLRGVCGILILFWPLLFVVAGTVLVGMGSRAEPTNFQKNIREMSI